MEHHRGVAATLSGHLEVISKVAFEFGAERTATDIGQPRLPGMSYRGNGIHKRGGEIRRPPLGGSTSIQTALPLLQSSCATSVSNTTPPATVVGVGAR